MNGGISRLQELNSMNMDALTLHDVRYICQRYNLYAVVKSGRIVRFEEN